VIVLDAFVAGFAASPLAPWADRDPWHLTVRAEEIVCVLLGGLDAGFAVDDGVAVHETARIETGAVVKPPTILGPGSFIAAGAYLRGGVWLQAEAIIGPGSELKSSFVFRGAKLAHFNFVGDSVLGEDVNLEAGAIVANFRNERVDKRLTFTHDGTVIDIGVEKFGALVGDRCRIGANAVIAPGALLKPGTVVARLALVDQGVA
jgi:NDP-sugar pyrophosphorylase family protein